MAWDPDKALIQVQVEPEFKERIQMLADTDLRSFSKEVVWLLEQGIRRRERMQLIDEAAEEGEKGEEPRA